MLTDDPTDLAGLARAERAAGDKAARDANQERDDLAWLMSGPRGRRIVWRQIDRSGVLTGSSFSPDAMTMAFSEGVRNPAMRLLGLVLPMDEFAAMVRENTPKPATNEEREDE